MSLISVGAFASFYMICAWIAVVMIAISTRALKRLVHTIRAGIIGVSTCSPIFYICSLTSY